MSDTAVAQITEKESMEVAEASRQKRWRKPSFMKDLFLGSFRLDLIDPYPLSDYTRPEFVAFFDALREFFLREVDANEIDTTGEYPPRVIEGLRELGA